MDTNNNDQYEPDRQETHEQEKDTRSQQAKEAVPGVPVVRSNTPRPFMYSTMTTVPPSALPELLPGEAKEAHTPSISAFPTKPPSAPPLPEEPDEYEEMLERGTYTPVATDKPIPTAQETEFVWLFEYALEMDSFHMNTPERLDGLALLYGAAVLKGYRLFLGSYEDENSQVQTLATIVPDTRPDAEVWGVVYRVPRDTTEGQGNEPALLDLVHDLPRSGMSELQVEVLETYRKRTLSCLTYGYEDAESAAQHLSVVKSQSDLNMYMRRLISIAEKQKLPETYIKRIHNIDISIPITPARNESHEIPVPATVARAEQHTEPIMLPVERLPKVHAQVPRSATRRVQSPRWFVAFAIYLFGLLLAVLALAVVQGMGVANDVLNDNFLLLHVPWLVLLYGLLGGCISSLVTLGRTKTPMDAPTFVIVTWFTRPFVGAVLALFAYLLLSSGLFSAVNTTTGRPEAMFLLVGAVAGMCEGWLFQRKR